MSDGLTSINDLKVVITAQTDQLAAGLSNASDLVSRFAADGEGKLGKMDGALAKIGTGIAALRGPLGLFVTAATTALDALEKLAEKGDAAFGKLGAEEQWTELKNAVAEIVPAFQDGVSGAFNAATGAVIQYGQAVSGIPVHNADAAASGTSVVGMLEALTEVAKRAAHELRRLAPAEGWSVDTVDAEIKRLTGQIESLNELTNRVTNAGSTSIIDKVVGLISPLHRDNLLTLDEMKTKLAELQAQLASLGETRTKKQWGVLDVDTTSPRLLDGIEREIEGLRLRAATLGMGAAEAAAYTAVERIKQDAERRGIEISEAMTEAMNRRLALMRQLRERIDAHAEAERNARREEQESARQQRTREMLVSSVDGEIVSLRAKQRALAGVTEAAMALEIQERLLAQAARNKVTLDESDLLVINAKSHEIARLKTQVAEYSSMLRAIEQPVGAVFKGIETIMTRSLDGTQMKMREVAVSVLGEIERMIIRLLVLKPLQESLTQGLSGMVGSGGMGSLFGSLFGGARAEGGPVSGGRAYLVGEQGPELFMPATSGNIIPNAAVAGGGGRGSGPLHVTVHTHIDARGAYPESIADIKSALAQQQQELPGRVLEVVSDAKQRGAE